MISAGVTGGIGTGKTIFCKELEKLGAEVVYADDLAKDMMVKDSGLREKLKKTFGENTYFEDGSLNKVHLIEQAFDSNRVEELNEIVHPALRKKTDELIQKARKNGKPLFVIEAAVLLNKGRPDHLDKIILIKSTREKQIQRVTKRDTSSEKAVISRMNKQPDFEKIEHLADFVIMNNGTTDDLKVKAREMFTRLTH